MFAFICTDEWFNLLGVGDWPKGTDAFKLSIINRQCTSAGPGGNDELSIRYSGPIWQLDFLSRQIEFFYWLK